MREQGPSGYEEARAASPRPMRRRAMASAAALLILGLCAGCKTPALKTLNWGPVASALDDARGDHRVRGMGPFFERTTSSNGMTMLAVRPFYSKVTDPAGRRERKDFLWPVAVSRTLKQEHQWRFLLMYYHDFDINDPTSRYRFVVFPVYFQGRDAHKQRYAAVFPIGGTIHEYLWRDRIAFVLFPLWARHSINEVVTTDVLWPVFSRTEGKGIYRFRIFPFYARSFHRDKFEKRFYMWPIFTWARYKDPGHAGTAYIVWPLWGRVKLDDERTWMVLPPLFRFSKGERMDYSYYPWPFIQHSRGLVEKIYLWPFWGEKRMHGVYRSFILWPIFWDVRVDRGRDLDRMRLGIPFYYSATKFEKQKGPDGRRPVRAVYRKIWPLFSWQRDEDESRFRMLELWPLRNTGPVERLYTPFWTLYERTRFGENVDHEFLWGLYRQQRRGTNALDVSLFPLWEWHRNGSVRSWRVLKGLIGWSSDGTQGRLQLLYWTGRREKETEP
jgi:hypothetical protein